VELGRRRDGNAAGVFYFEREPRYDRIENGGGAMAKKAERLRIDYLPLTDLLTRKSPDNAKLHDLIQMAYSFGKFGFVAPAGIDETTGLLLWGHGRLDELYELKESGAKPPGRIEIEGDEWLVPTVRGIRLGKKLGPLYRMADNAIGEGLWDKDKLAQTIIAAVGDQLEELQGTGIEPDYASALIEAYQKNGKEDKPPPNTEDVKRLRRKWKTKLGDFYDIGSHRLIVGDATDGEIVTRLFAGEKASAVLTDPPYGMMKDGILNDDPRGLSLLYGEAIANLPMDKGVVVAFQSPRLNLLTIWLDRMTENKYKLERLLWVYFTNTTNSFPWRGWILTGQAIVISSKGRPRWPRKKLDYQHDTYTRIGKEDEELDGKHPTVKPAWIFSDLLKRLPYGIVYDPFLGSGTTMAVAEGMGRACYGLEIDPGYAAVTLERMSKIGVKISKKEKTK
jgi:DNA modification methylase